MARTSKSRGALPFQMRSGNETPYKLFGGLKKKIMKGVANFTQKTGLMDKALGVTGVQPGEGAQTPEQQAMVDQRIQTMRTGGVGAMNQALGGKVMPRTAFDSPMFKKQTPYNKLSCEYRSPMKAADVTLVRGQYDATSGKGTAKYGQIAKSRAFSDMSQSIADATSSAYSNSLRKKKREWKKDKKFQKWLNRKRRGWKDVGRWGTV